MTSYSKEIDLLKFKLSTINSQYRTKVITSEEYDNLFKQLEHELRLLEEKIFNNKTER